MNCVYRIFNGLNGKSYIGITSKGFANRWTEHKYSAKTCERDCKLYQAINKHGIETFKWEILEQNIPEHELPIWEELYIKQYDSYRNGYNMTEKTYGRAATKDSTREKLRQINTGRKMSDEAKANMSKSQKLRFTRPDQIERRREIMTGSSWSEESRKKMSASMKGRKITWDTGFRGNAYTVKQYCIRFPDGSENLIKNLAEFCRQNELKNSHLRDTLSGKRRQHKGYVLLSKFNDQPKEAYPQVRGNGAHPVLLQGEDMISSVR